jgi:hypothetical protein
MQGHWVLLSVHLLGTVWHWASSHRLLIGTEVPASELIYVGFMSFDKFINLFNQHEQLVAAE